MGSSAPTSIYASPSNDPDRGAYDQLYNDNPGNDYASPYDDEELEPENPQDTEYPSGSNAPPF